MLEQNNFQDLYRAEEVPLAELFTSQGEISKYSDLYQQKVSEFIRLSERIDLDKMDEAQITEQVVKNAITVEFGSKLGEDFKMINIIKEAILSDSSLTLEVLNFARKYAKGFSINQTLIN